MLIDCLLLFFLLYISRRNSFLFVYFFLEASIPSEDISVFFYLEIVSEFRMPFKGGENPQCPRCGHSAFHAESIPAAGKVWHKICFRCGKKKTKPHFENFHLKIN